MTRTMPGLDRITYQDLTKRAVDIEHAMRAHVKACDLCSKAGSQVHEHCFIWVRHAIDAHKIRRKLRSWDCVSPDTQPQLPGMDEL